MMNGIVCYFHVLVETNNPSNILWCFDQGFDLPKVFAKTSIFFSTKPHLHWLRCMTTTIVWWNFHLAFLKSGPKCIGLRNINLWYIPTIVWRSHIKKTPQIMTEPPSICLMKWHFYKGKIAWMLIKILQFMICFVETYLIIPIKGSWN